MKTRLNFFLHSAPGEFEYAGFTMKRFLSTLRQRKLKTQQSWVIVDLCLHDYRWYIVFSKSYVFKMLSFTLKRKAGVFNSSGLKSVFGSSVFVTDKCER